MAGQLPDNHPNLVRMMPDKAGHTDSYLQGRAVGRNLFRHGYCAAKAAPAAGTARERGFTLIELIMVIVILGILALGTTRYIVQSTQQYTQSADRARLVASGRVAIEQVTRRLRNALPNSIRVAAGCIEYMPVVAASSSIGDLPTGTTLTVAPFNLPAATPDFVVIAPFSPLEIYNPPGAGVVASAITGIGPVNGEGNIPINFATPFLRTSPTNRVFFANRPERFCLAVNGQLTRFFGYGVLPNLTAAPPATGGSELVAEYITGAGSGFQYQPGFTLRNGLATVTFNLERNGEPVNLTHRVQIRNVP